jgi:hypothetical protein
MRQFVFAGLFMSALLLSFKASAQFSVNSLFAPIDFRLSAQLYETITGDFAGRENPAGFILRDPNNLLSVDEESNAWKNWSYVDNYAFGQDRGAIPMITDLHSLHPYFRDQILELIARCKAKGIELAIVETYRTHAKQREYNTMGKSYTKSRAGQSRHQYGLAIDVVPIVNSKPVWNNTSLWRKIGVAGEKLGLRWGGRWRDPYDPGHFEWTGGLTSNHLIAGKFPSKPGFAERYPCLEEDLKILQRHWNEWETSQRAWTRK